MSAEPTGVADGRRGAGARGRRAAWRRRLAARLGGAPSGAALVFFALAAAGQRGPLASVGAGLAAALVGALYGLAVGALVRLFPRHPVVQTVAGGLAAPAVLALFVRVDDEGGFLVAAAVLGLALGVLEYGAGSRSGAHRPAEGSGGHAGTGRAVPAPAAVGEHPTPGDAVD